MRRCLCRWRSCRRSEITPYVWVHRTMFGTPRRVGVPSENLGACVAPMAARLNITLRGQNGVSPNCCRSLKMLWSIAGCLFGMLLLRRKILPVLPLDRKASAVRPPDPTFPYLRLGVIAAAIIIAALFSVLGRPGTEKVESPKAVAIATRPSIISPSSAPPQILASIDCQPSQDLHRRRPINQRPQSGKPTSHSATPDSCNF